MRSRASVGLAPVLLCEDGVRLSSETIVFSWDSHLWRVEVKFCHTINSYRIGAFNLDRGSRLRLYLLNWSAHRT